jgi:hypothetical protein
MVLMPVVVVITMLAMVAGVAVAAFRNAPAYARPGDVGSRNRSGKSGSTLVEIGHRGGTGKYSPCACSAVGVIQTVINAKKIH